MLQGFGAPSCAKILTSWFAAKERGTYWVCLPFQTVLFSTSKFSVYLAGYVEHSAQPRRIRSPTTCRHCRSYAWLECENSFQSPSFFVQITLLLLHCTHQWGLWAPGIVALLVGSVILSSLKDSPEARGYEPVEELRGISSQSKPKFSLPALIRFSMNTYSYRAVGTLSETVDKDSVEKFFTSKVSFAALTFHWTQGEESLLDNLFQNVLSNPFIW